MKRAEKSFIRKKENRGSGGGIQTGLGGPSESAPLPGGFLQQKSHSCFAS